VLWRDILPGGIRDHSLAVLGDAPRPARATFDGWKVNACPHHGPSLAIADGAYHLAWFTAEGKNGGGLFYARSSDGGATYGEPRRLGPAVGCEPRVRARVGRRRRRRLEGVARGRVGRARDSRSTDGGRTFAAARDAAATAGRADHPLLAVGRPGTASSRGSPTPTATAWCRSATDGRYGARRRQTEIGTARVRPRRHPVAELVARSSNVRAARCPPGSGTTSARDAPSSPAVHGDRAEVGAAAEDRRLVLSRRPPRPSFPEAKRGRSDW
jgi:hypothetical protein